MSNENNLGCLGCKGDYATQYMGIFTSQHKDPYYKPTSIMESRMVFFVAHMCWVERYLQGLGGETRVVSY